MFKKSLLKVALAGIMLVTVNVGFAQTSDSKWEVEYLTNDFGDKTGECNLIQTTFDENWLEYTIVIFKIETGFAFGFRCKDFKKEITDSDAYLSYKTENNKVIEAKKGFYWSNSQIAGFEMSNEIVSLFKNSSKLKIALRLPGYTPAVMEVDCMGFTKAFNEMIICK